MRADELVCAVIGFLLSSWSLELRMLEINVTPSLLVGRVSAPSACYFLEAGGEKKDEICYTESLWGKVYGWNVVLRMP
jgi:hypothetical protein